MYSGKYNTQIIIKYSQLDQYNNSISYIHYLSLRDPEVDGSLKEDKGIKYQFKVYEHIKS